MRAPDGAWHVLADRTGLADGLAHALQNRRRLGRVLPELFASQMLCRIDPFVEICLDMMQSMTPTGTGEPGRSALLTPGHSDPVWYEHVLLARELSCALVEGGDLTVRDGGLFLKTLRGLQPISVLLRGVGGRSVDPLELEPDGLGVPGLLAAARNSMRSSTAPAAGSPSRQPLRRSCRIWRAALLGEDLALPSVPTLWLGDDAAHLSVLRGPGDWRVRPALRGQCRRRASSGRAAGGDGRGVRGAAARPGAAAPWRFVATAESLTIGNTVPRRRCIGAASRAGPHVPGPRPNGLARHAGRPRLRATRRAQTWPSAGQVLAKDVWVLAENPAAIEGPPSEQDAAAGDPTHCRGHAEPGGRQLLLARALPGAARRRGTPAAHRHWPCQPAGADTARACGTGGADRLPDARPACSTPRPSPDWAPPGSARHCCARPEAGDRSTPCSAGSRA